MMMKNEINTSLKKIIAVLTVSVALGVSVLAQERAGVGIESGARTGNASVTQNSATTGGGYIGSGTRTETFLGGGWMGSGHRTENTSSTVEKLWNWITSIIP